MVEPGQILGYMHLQFCVSEGPPLLCVLNMQLRAHVMGKGLGKFALQLVEVCARASAAVPMPTHPQPCLLAEREHPAPLRIDAPSLRSARP